MSNTRWLSIEAVVSRILEQWVQLKHLMTAETFEHNQDIAFKINKDMNDMSKAYFLFLSYVLKIVTNMNLSESPKIHLLIPAVTSNFKILLSNFN